MLAPILPSPIIPSCISTPSSNEMVAHFSGLFRWSCRDIYPLDHLALSPNLGQGVMNERLVAPHRNVGQKVSIHGIDVNSIGATAHRFDYLLTQTGKVSGE